jgi:phosphate transport system permease protein
LIADRLGSWLVIGGGLGIILSILSILLFIVIEIWPLIQKASVQPAGQTPLPSARFLALLTDEYHTLAAGMTADARIQVVRLADGALLAETALFDDDGGTPAASLTRVRNQPGANRFQAATADGRVLAVAVDWRISFVQQTRQIEAVIEQPIEFQMDPESNSVEVFAVSVADGGEATAAALLADGRIALVRREVRENLMTGEIAESFKRDIIDTPVRPTQLLIDQDRRCMYGAAADGTLLLWDLRAPDVPPQQAGWNNRPVTALSLLIGHRSLVVGRDDGAIGIWFQVRMGDGQFRLQHIRDLPALSGAVTAISPSMRNKGFIAMTGDEAALYHSTTDRLLWRGNLDADRPGALLLAPRGDAALIADASAIHRLSIANPHPEATLAGFFGRIWYEGYEKPEFVWQSTGGSDDFEPKLSLSPLLYGTLKGTIFSLLLAIPLGVLGAMYTSQFMNPLLQRYVKPTIEVMAALPTVVLGFLAGLWLAPKIQSAFPALIMSAFVLPAMIVAAGAAWRQVPLRVRGRFLAGSEALMFTVVLALGIWLCASLSPWFETLAFGGSFPVWLRETTGWTYDQRNAVVVGLAMGFAVIPIIFAISEDAFTNVPRNLVSGSLALGANRWQTVTRVVLPTASPGVFSAIMIGFGRAVGETMIVLMATGNTPIMDWSPFNGFRTLSANIAVEIPEAPVGGTLYRTLFLAALLLFMLTFLVNTVAEVIRLRLRRRYAKL